MFMDGETLKHLEPCDFSPLSYVDDKKTTVKQKNIIVFFRNA